MIKMLPCPFCGGKGILQEEELYYPVLRKHKKRWFPLCSGNDALEYCPMMNPENDGEQGGVTVSWESEEEAIKAWNTRV
jgi:hypothetical protein